MFRYKQINDDWVEFGIGDEVILSGHSLSDLDILKFIEKHVPEFKLEIIHEFQCIYCALPVTEIEFLNGECSNCLDTGV